MDYELEHGTNSKGNKVSRRRRRAKKGTSDAGDVLAVAGPTEKAEEHGSDILEGLVSHATELLESGVLESQFIEGLFDVLEGYVER